MEAMVAVAAILFLRSIGSLNTLSKFRFRKFEAQNGKEGGSQNKTGSDGNNLVIEVPCGTLIYESNTNKAIADLIDDREKYVFVEVGRVVLVIYVLKALQIDRQQSLLRERRRISSD